MIITVVATITTVIIITSPASVPSTNAIANKNPSSHLMMEPFDSSALIDTTTAQID